MVRTEAVSQKNTTTSTRFLDAGELAEYLNVPESWIRSQTRSRTRTAEQIPHARFGRYVRFPWPSAELEAWVAKHMRGGR